MSEEKKEKASSHARGDEVHLSRTEYEDLLARLKELEGMKDRFLHSAADFDNAKKRLMRERDEFVKFSQENLVRHILPVLDNFERALSHARAMDSGKNTSDNLKGIVAGIEMVFKQLADILKKQGLVRQQTIGQLADPHQHEVVGHVHEEGKDDEIVEEIEPGYLLHDRLLRAAKVRVRQSPEEIA